MAAATLAGIWQFQLKVASRRERAIKFCLGLESEDAKYLNRLSTDWYDDLDYQSDEKGLSRDWPPDVDNDNWLEKLINSPSDLGDADIICLLGQAAGAAGNPLRKSLHAEVMLLLRSLYFRTQDPELLFWHVGEDGLSDEQQEDLKLCALEQMAQIACEHREKLEKITPEMLEAEAKAACRLLEGQQHDENTSGAREQPAGTGTQTGKAATCNQLMMEIILSNPNECVGWSASQWSQKVGKSESTVKETEAWDLIQGMRAHEILDRAKPKDRQRRPKKHK